MTRALAFDQSLLAGGMLYASAFTGAAGSALPAEWQTVTGTPAGSVTQDGAGYANVQANNGSAWNGSQPGARLTTVSSANLDLIARFQAPGENGYVPQFWPAFGIGITSLGIGQGYFTSGYTMGFALANGTWSIQDAAGNSLSGDVAVPGGVYTPKAIYGIHLQRLVSPTPLIRARLWLGSAAEPTAWGYSGTPSATAAGSIGALSGQGGDTEVRPFKFNSVVLTNGS